MAEIYKTVTLSEEIIQLGKAETTTIEAKNAAEFSDEDLQEIKSKAQTEGYQTGFDQGFNEGTQKSEELMMEQMDKLNTLIQSISSAIMDTHEQIKDDIANIVCMITQRFFMEKQKDKQNIVQHVTNTLSQIHDKQNITLFLHPQDLSMLTQGEISIDLSACKTLKIAHDERLAMGGCIIQNDHGLFDASIERQIDNLKEMLLQLRNGEGHV